MPSDRMDEWLGVEHPRTAPHWPDCRCLTCSWAEIDRLRSAFELSERERLREGMRSAAATARPDWEARKLYEACVEFFQFHGNPNTVHAMRTAMKAYEASLGEFK